MLQLKGLELRQGSFELVANLRVRAGRRVAVIGPSGAGKSTLLNAIAGFLPHRGRVVIAGQDITQHRPEARGIAMLFQDANLFPHLTLLQNVGLGLRARLRLRPEEKALCTDALARVGLAGYERRRPAELSGGQQSRAALARVLVQRNPLLLLDEPFAALGPALRREMLDLVAELSEETGATVLLVTHSPEDVTRFAQDAIWIENGRAAPPQDAKQLIANPPEGLEAYLGRTPG